MAEQFHLGFDIDTKPLANAKTAAADAAQAIGKLGDAEQNLSQKSALATEQQKKLEDAIKKTQQAAAQNQGAQQFASDIGRMTSAMGGATNAAAAMSGALGSGSGGGGLGSALQVAAGGFGRMASVLGPTGMILGATAVAIGVVGKQTYDAAAALAKFADDSNLMEARLKNALGSTYAARDAMQSLYKSTQDTGTGFAAAADSFLRLARNSEALGATRSEIQTLSETVQKLGLISGAGRGEIASGMIQLSQALASGRLNGDELRSIMENLPALAKAIADGLGKSVGEMRAMGAAGELTGSKVFAAILKQSDKVNEEFKTLPNTAEREFQKVGDAWDQLLADIGKKTNSSDWVQGIARMARSAINAARGAMPDNSPGGRLAALDQEEGDIKRFAIVDRSARLAEIKAERERIQDQARRDLRTMENDTAQEDLIRQNKPILDASSISKDLDDRASKITAITGNIKQLEAGIAALQAKPLLTEAETKQLDQFNRTLGIAKKQLDDTKTPVQSLADDFGKLSAAIAQGGGGGATGLIQQAQKLSESMQKIGMSGGGALGTLINQEVMKGGDQLRTLGIQVQQQTALAAAVGGTREQTRELEISNELLLKRFQMFGDLKSPVIDGFFGKLTIAMREQKIAADAAAVAQANYANALEASINKAQGGAAGNSGLQRAIAASMRAAEADRLRPGTFDGEIDKFNAIEGLNAQNQIAGIKSNTELQRILGGSMGSDRERQLAQLEFNIAAAQRNLTPQARTQYGESLAGEMRAQDSAQFNADRANETRGLQRQITSGQRRGGLIGLPPDELRVQTAILEKQLQLEQQGLQAGQAQYDTQIALTEQLARQNIAYDKQRALVESIHGSIDSVASTVKSSFADSWVKAFKTGEFSAKEFFGSIGDMAVRAGAEMTYEIAIKPLVALAANAAKAGITQFLGMGGGGVGGGSGGGGFIDAGSVPVGPTFAANGMAFGSGGIKAFANGGTFTNGLYDSPTLFRFANGGALGVMGEAGPEAVMPLRRGPDGKLGVSGGGGGGDVQIIVNDMRSGKDSAPVEASSMTGPGGLRQIQIMVRDEIRRSMGAGEFDRTMQTNFGASRQIARK
jgi:tape measure domain-containing protein